MPSLSLGAGTPRTLASVSALWFVAAFSASAAAETTPAAVADRAFPYPMRESKLDNGVRVVIVPMPGSGMFAWYGVVGTGSRDEVEAGHSGFAHFFEHMMFRGTKRFPSEARVALLGSLGVDESGYTTDDFTTYHLQGPKEALARIVELEGDRYQNLEYSEGDFKTESKAVLGEYNKNFSNPDNKANEVLSELAFDKHTYKHTTMGFLADIQRMPNEYQYSREFFRRFYTPDNLLLIVVGDVEEEPTLALVRQHFGGWRGKRVVTQVQDEAPLKAERRKEVAWDNPTQDRLHVAWRVPSAVRDKRAGAAAMVLRAYLFSDSSALSKAVVLDEQLAETLASWYDPHKDATLFPVVAKIKEGKSADAVLARVQQALDDVAAGKIDERRFAAVKSNVRYSMLMGFTSADSVAGSVAYVAGPFAETADAAHAIDATLGAVKALTPAELAAFTKGAFGKDQRAIVTLKYQPKDSKAKGGGN